ncbi:MAG: hypothetical protein JW940_01765 [Polyangiaceae bacterium]|nr:hypothetical protein [Polyangiaceae bacterium]
MARHTFRSVAFSSAALALTLSVVARPASKEPRHYTRGVQRCHSECQSRKTDCILRCDGETDCELGCQSTAEQCVAQCDKGAPGATGGPKTGKDATPKTGKPAPKR